MVVEKEWGAIEIDNMYVYINYVIFVLETFIRTIGLY